MEEKMGQEGFWDDVENANKLNQRMKVVSAKVDKYDKLMRRAEDLETLIEMAEEEDDESLLEEIASEFEGLNAAVEALQLETLLKGPYDSSNAVLSLHAGACG
ncbi:MAG: PCRF domain-containing protein, partial [Clostridia bacterium]|nr:PCRF domain-containing protein [Clostridia bacterium]